MTTMSYGTNATNGSGGGDVSGDDINSSAAEHRAQEPQHGEDAEPTSFGEKARSFYHKNIGLLFIFIAQMFASIMSMTTRLLATGFDVKFHALQIIFVRMVATAIICFAWMWYKQIPDSPWGPPAVRKLLVLRGMAGSVGLFGLYYSLSYLDVSDATVITFLVPTITSFVCWVALGEPFTSSEATAGLIALVGVIFIARPGFLFPSPRLPDSNASHVETHDTDGEVVPMGGLVPPVESSPLERSVAVGCAILGAFCAATAYATIRVIGKRAHSLVSVNYFATLACVSSFVIIMVHPELRFEIPKGPVQWALLVSIGVSGFIFQILLTEGLQREKAGRAANMIYTQLIFSLIIDFVVWGTGPSLTSVFGGALIISAAVWVSLQQKSAAEKKDRPHTDEESRLLGPDGEAAEERV